VLFTPISSRDMEVKEGKTGVKIRRRRSQESAYC